MLGLFSYTSSYHVFIYLVTICTLSLVKYLLESFAHFLNWAFAFLLFNFVSSLHILDILSLQIYVLQSKYLLSLQPLML